MFLGINPIQVSLMPLFQVVSVTQELLRCIWVEMLGLNNFIIIIISSLLFFHFLSLICVKST